MVHAVHADRAEKQRPNGSQPSGAEDEHVRRFGGVAEDAACVALDEPRLHSDAGMGCAHGLETPVEMFLTVPLEELVGKHNGLGCRRTTPGGTSHAVTAVTAAPLASASSSANRSASVAPDDPSIPTTIFLIAPTSLTLRT